MKILFKKVYKFDLDKGKAYEMPSSGDLAVFNDYLEHLIEEVIGSPRGRTYSFPKDPTAIMNTIERVVAGERSAAATLDMANRLLRIEENVQARIEHMEKEVQRGKLILAHVTYNEQELFLVIKAENVEIVNEIDNQLAKGLPTRNKIFKSACIFLDDDHKPTSAIVTDYNTSISTYWWQEFLELEQIYTDAYNTERSFEVLDRKVFSDMKREFPSDYMNLRNATTVYFRTNQTFEMADYLDKVIKPYIPEDDNLDVLSLGTRIDTLPEKGKFDRHFDISKEKLKKKIITRLRLSPVLELVIKENINLKDDIRAYEEKGVKYISIRTDEGYKFFKKDK